METDVISRCRHDTLRQYIEKSHKTTINLHINGSSCEQSEVTTLNSSCEPASTVHLAPLEQNCGGVVVPESAGTLENKIGCIQQKFGLYQKDHISLRAIDAVGDRNQASTFLEAEGGDGSNAELAIHFLESCKAAATAKFSSLLHSAFAAGESAAVAAAQAAYSAASTAANVPLSLAALAHSYSKAQEESEISWSESVHGTHSPYNNSGQDSIKNCKSTFNGIVCPFHGRAYQKTKVGFSVRRGRSASRCSSNTLRGPIRRQRYFTAFGVSYPGPYSVGASQRRLQQQLHSLKVENSTSTDSNSFSFCPFCAFLSAAYNVILGEENNSCTTSPSRTGAHSGQGLESGQGFLSSATIGAEISARFASRRFVKTEIDEHSGFQSAGGLKNSKSSPVPGSPRGSLWHVGRSAVVRKGDNSIISHIIARASSLRKTASRKFPCSENSCEQSSKPSMASRAYAAAAGAAAAAVAAAAAAAPSSLLSRVGRHSDGRSVAVHVEGEQDRVPRIRRSDTYEQYINFRVHKWGDEVFDELEVNEVFSGPNAVSCVIM